MPKFQVIVEKKLTSTGIIEVTAKDAKAAVKQVRDRIGTIALNEIEWDDPEYQEDSLKCYGEVIKV